MPKVRLLLAALLLLLAAGTVAAESNEAALPAPELFAVAWDDLEVFFDPATSDLATPAAVAAARALEGASVYHLEWVIGTDPTRLTGRAEVRYTNRSDAPLAEVVFHLLPRYLGGRIVPDEVRVGGAVVTPELLLGGAALRVPLAAALPPGGAVVVAFRYRLEVPDDPGDSFGIFAAQPEMLALAHAYPLAAVYEGGAWDLDVPSPNGDLAYADSSFYRLRVIAPAEQVVVASGRQLARRVEGGIQTLSFVAGPVRDVFVAVGDFAVVTDEVEVEAAGAVGSDQATPETAGADVGGSDVADPDAAGSGVAGPDAAGSGVADPDAAGSGVEAAGVAASKVAAAGVAAPKINVHVRSYFLPGDEDGAREALEVATKALELLGARFGDYPFREFELVPLVTPVLGVEFPGVVALAARLYRPGGAPRGFLEGTTVHEVAHQWFYSAVGNDQVSEPWLDESLAQYATLKYFEDRYGPAGAQGFRRSLEGRWGRVNRAATPIGLPVEAYSAEAYGAIVYGRGPLALEQLEAQVGSSVFDAFLRDYYARFLFGRVHGADVRALAEAHCGCDLGEFWRNVIGDDGKGSKE